MFPMRKTLSAILSSLNSTVAALEEHAAYTLLKADECSSKAEALKIDEDDYLTQSMQASRVAGRVRELIS